MTPALVGRAIGMFAVTNVDDLVLLALFFAAAPGRAGAVRVVAGQYLGFSGILLVSVLAALGARLLPQETLPYLGLVPLLLGLRAGWRVWREKSDAGDGAEAGGGSSMPASALAVAGVTFANGGDNLGVYVPVLANVGAAALVTFVVVFLVMVGVWCAAGRLLATRPPVARVLARWGHILLPLVLVAIGVTILVGGGAFGL